MIHHWVLISQLLNKYHFTLQTAQWTTMGLIKKRLLVLIRVAESSILHLYQVHTSHCKVHRKAQRLWPSTYLLGGTWPGKSMGALLCGEKKKKRSVYWKHVVFCSSGKADFLNQDVTMYSIADTLLGFWVGIWRANVTLDWWDRHPWWFCWTEGSAIIILL